MDIKEFFQVCEKFFVQINSNICEDNEDEDIEKVQKTSEELLEEGEDGEMGFYTMCCLMIDTLLLINPKKSS